MEFRPSLDRVFVIRQPLKNFLMTAKSFDKVNYAGRDNMFSHKSQFSKFLLITIESLDFQN